MRKTLYAYGIGAAALIAAVAIRWLLDTWLGDAFPLTTLYAAIAFTEWAAGSRPAIVVAVLGYAACSWFFIEPRGTLMLRERPDAIGLSIYAVSALAIVYFGERLVAARQQAQTSGNAARHEALERRRAEEALRRVDRRKDEFVATVVHELRTPLSVIRQGVHVLSRSSMSDAAYAACDAIERQVARMSRLLEDLLDVHRIGRGEIEILKTPLSIAEVVSSAIEIARPLINERQHRLETNVPDEPLMIVGDCLRLSQALANLLTNSARYTPLGGRIVVTCLREDQSVAIHVVDNGVGIDPAFQPQLFSLFARGDDVAVVREDGLGIGLSLARALVEAHGGRIEARSDGRGKGCTFVVRLPLQGGGETTPTTSSLAVLPTAGRQGTSNEDGPWNDLSIASNKPT